MRKEQENKRTVFDLVMKVAELGLLRANKEELAKMESYCHWTWGSMGYFYEITDHNIYKIEIDDNDKEIKEDITFDTLLDIYGTLEEQKLYRV